MASIICGNKTHGGDTVRHSSVDHVKGCYAGHIHPCIDLVQELGEDGYYTRECGADSWLLHENGEEIGVTCDRGHEHLRAEYMARKRMAYMDEEEARGYWDAVRHGQLPAGIETTILMDGKVYVP